MPLDGQEATERPESTQQVRKMTVEELAEMAAVQGRKRWEELHRRALGWAGGEDAQWLADFAMRLPCGECRTHWFGMLKRTPPDWANYFAWAVARHNEVNRRLGKPEITEGEARKIW